MPEPAAIMVRYRHGRACAHVAAVISWPFGRVSVKRIAVQIRAFCTYGQQPGAFCRSLGPRELPRIHMSYFGTANDVVALAHEFGHALQFTLAGRRCDGLTYDAPECLGEISPAFAELLVCDWLLASEPDPGVRDSIAARRVETSIGAVFFSAFPHPFPGSRSPGPR